MPGAAAGTPAGRPPVLTVGFSLCSAPRLPQRPQREDRDMAEGLQVGAAGPRGAGPAPPGSVCSPRGVGTEPAAFTPGGDPAHGQGAGIALEVLLTEGLQAKAPTVAWLGFWCRLQKRRFRGAASVLRGPQEPWHSLE